MSPVVRQPPGFDPPSPRGAPRAGAGRWLYKGPPRVTHAARPFHDGRHPAHVTLRVRSDVAPLRTACVLEVVRAVLPLAEKPGFRVVHYSIQPRQFRLVVEAADRMALARGVQGLAVRLARRINRALGRRGKFFDDRYDARSLPSPIQVFHALCHVVGVPGIDRFSSGATGRVTPPRTWLLRSGWRRGRPP